MFRSLSISVLMIVWGAVFLGSGLIAYFTEPTGLGYSRGMNIVHLFFSWQMVALILAGIIWIAGDRLVYGSRLHRLVHVPILAALILVLLILGVFGTLWFGV